MQTYGFHLLLLLQKIRDESHRFALKYHHVLKSKEIDELDDILKKIELIGEQRSNLLRKYFKTLKAIKEAPLDELEGVLISKKAAIAVYEHFHGRIEPN